MKKIIIAFLALFTLSAYPVSTVNACTIYAKTVTLTSSDGWKTIHHCIDKGLNRNVTISITATSVNKYGLDDADIRMLSKSGRVLWTGKVKAAGFQKFWCGSDVYTLQIRIPNGVTSVYIQPN